MRSLLCKYLEPRRGVIFLPGLLEPRRGVIFLPGLLEPRRGCRMLPRWHIFFGAIFTIIIWIAAPQTNLIYIALIFLSSFLIDFDHYLNVAIKTRKVRLKHALEYHKHLGKIEESENKKGLRKRGDFHIFHTIEFHLLIAILAFLWTPFFYIFIGMIFHSLLDLFWLLLHDRFYRREFFFFNWVIK